MTTTTDHAHDSHAHDAAVPVLPVNVAPFRRVAVLSAVVGLIAWVILGVLNLAHDDHGRDFFATYQIAFVYWLSVPMGSLVLMCIAYTTSASWGLVNRRIFQASFATLPVMALLFLPVVVSLFVTEASPFWWAQGDQALPDVKEAKVEQAHRQKLYLNPLFFLIRAAVCFGAWILLARGIAKHAPASEDRGDEVAWGKLRSLAAPGILIWALLTTVAMTDWVMSVEMSWASTMFPVVAGVNQFLTAFAFSVFIFYTIMRKNDVVLTIVKAKFRIDIGSLMLGFAMVWAYASFSQFMLIWAGNLPEEVGYYRKRLNGGWEYLSYALIAFHWLVPFFVLLFRGVKLDPDKMRAMTFMLLCICAGDVIWWILPTFPHTGYLHFPMAVAAIVGVGGVWGIAFTGQLAKKPLLPAKDAEYMTTWGHH